MICVIVFQCCTSTTELKVWIWALDTLFSVSFCTISTLSLTVQHSRLGQPKGARNFDSHAFWILSRNFDLQMESERERDRQKPCLSLLLLHTDCT